LFNKGNVLPCHVSAKNLKEKIMTNYIQEGFHSVTPNFIFKDTQKAIEFYKKAFSVTVLDIFKSPDGKGIMHATIKIGNSILMMGDEMPQCKSAESLGASPISLYLFTPDSDKLFAQALAAGGEVKMPMADMFWGDRCGTIMDPFGYSWMLATHKQELTVDQVNKGAEEFYAQMSKK
jgi:uncharacterized glyoxalase superfamily protein PhnB